MRKLILAATAFIFFQSGLLAQNYTVVYEKELKPDIGNQLDQITDPVLKKQLEEQLTNVKMELYVLRHKDGISNFVKKVTSENKKDETLELEGAQTKANVNVVKIGRTSKASILYKGLTHGTYLRSSNLMGKEFLVKDTLTTYNWKKSKETKTIGNYVCQKATAIHDGKEITAWYSPSIPISDGPNEYYGLPGLIIQLIEGGDTVYNALSVQETPEISIIKPSKGKEISKAKYQKLKQERIEAIKQQFGN